MPKGWRWTGWLARLLNGVMLVSLAALFLLPFLWMLSTALKTQAQVYAFPPTWLPSPVSLETLRSAWRLLDFPLYLRNTLVVALLTTLGSLLTSSLVGYALAFLPARGQRWLLLLALGSAIFPPTVALIPQFLLMSWLGWVDTYLPLILPAVFGNVIYIFLFRQYFKTLPYELIESAELDGCNPLTTYARIGLPLARPVVVLVGVFAFIGAWNDFLGPLVYLSSQSRYTLSLGLSLFQSAHQPQLHFMMPMSFLALLPIVAIFVLSQSFLDTGLFGELEL
jgi:multiple sugar transport system permease protein